MTGAPIVHFCQGTEGYGVQRVVLDLLEMIDGTRLAYLEEGPLAERVRAAGVPTQRLDGYEPFHAFQVRLGALPALVRKQRRNARRFAAWCQDEGVRIVHTHLLAHHLLGGFAARRSGGALRNAWHIHVTPGRGRLGALTAALHRYGSLRYADRVIAISQAAAGPYRSRWRDHVRVVYNGVRLPPELNEQEAARLRTAYHAWKPFVISWAGRVLATKGLHVVIDALSRLGSADVGLVVLGDTLDRANPDSSYQVELADQIERAGLTEQVRFAGRVDNVLDHFAACDVSVHSRIDPEPFGLVIIEAQAAGSPVIAAGAGGVLEIITDGQTGRLVPPDDAGTLAEALAEVIAAPDDLARWGSAGQKRVTERFSATRVAGDVCNVYAELGVSATLRSRGSAGRTAGTARADAASALQERV